MDAHLRAMYSAFGDKDLFQKVQDAKVLVVGAGGIGCELLKNLVLSGFRHIQAVDLDTIDVTNLNRQFLFRKQHVGQSKAKIAALAVKDMNFDVDIDPVFGNIKDPKFGLDHFEKITLVMNALDNLDARRHVNRMCLSTKTPLIESGTQGYLGQVSAIFPGESECFECKPVAAQQTYAVCTIRHTPDKPVHCVVWAKYIFSSLFGPHDDENLLSDVELGWTRTHSQDADAATSAADHARELFARFFTAEMEESRTVKDRWVTRAPPLVLKLEQLSLQEVTASVETQPRHLRVQRVLSVAECASIFLQSTQRLLVDRADEVGRMEFDKDDQLAMDFVAAAANLRMHAFGIAMETEFAVQGIAGNIIHAVASTNAIAAGLMVVEALKVLAGKKETCRMTWITRSVPRVLQSFPLEQPNKECFVCGKQTLQLRLNCATFTVRKLYEVVLKKRIGMIEPCIDVTNRENYLGLQEDHPPAYQDKHLMDAGVGITDGAVMCVEDYQQDVAVNLLVRHVVKESSAESPEESETTDGFELCGKIEEHKATVASEQPAVAAPAAAESTERKERKRTPTTRERAPSIIDLDSDMEEEKKCEDLHGITVINLDSDSEDEPPAKRRKLA